MCPYPNLFPTLLFGSMNNWLSNIKGQISELASEVLQEATEEVEDPETELQVERKKCAEAERQLVVEKSSTEALHKKINELEEQLYSANLENDATREKFEHMIYDRDAHIKKLQIEIEQSRFHQHDDQFKPVSFQTIDLTGEEDRPSRAEPNAKPSTSTSAANIEAVNRKHFKEIALLKEKHEQEIQALMSVNAENVRHLREEYEARINELQQNQPCANQPRLWIISELGADMPTSNIEVAEQKTELVTDSSYSELSTECERLQMLVEEMKQQTELLKQEIHSRDSKIEQLYSQLEQERKKVTEGSQLQTSQSDKNDKEIERLKSVNNELMSAYNELNKEFEDHKSKNTTIAVTNADLVARIDALKATLIEYEESYEMCKSEQNETAGQLTKLTADFDRLRNNFHTSKAVAESNEEKLNGEVEILRNSLQQAKVDREQLHNDISRFRDSVKSIDSELNLLRDNNRRLEDENKELSESVARYESLRDMLNKSNEGLGDFREHFTAMQNEHAAQINRLTEEKEQLQRQLQSMEVKPVADLLDKEAQTEGVETVFMGTTTIHGQASHSQQTEEEHASTAHKDTHLLKRHPSSDADSASAGSNSGWERMGAEWVGNETIASTAVSSSSSSGSNGKGRREEDGSHKVEEEEIHHTTTSQQSSPKGGSAVDSLTHSEGDVEEADAHHKLDEANLLISSLRQRLVRVEAEMQESRDQLQSRTEELAHQQQLYHQLLEVSEARATELKDTNQEMQELKSKLDSNSAYIHEQQQRVQQLTEEKMMEKQQLEELTIQLNESTTACQMMQSANTELEQEKQRLESSFEALRSEYQEKASRLEVLTSDSSLANMQLEEAKQHIANLEQELSAFTHKFEQQTSSVQELTEKDAEQLAHLTTENQELKKILGEKHAESQAYYDKLQELSANHQVADQKLKTAENELMDNRQQLVISQESQERMHKELSRLREHLLTMEEMSTKEAVAAEERETDLRREIRLLQENTSSISSTVAQSNTQSQEEIASLRAQVSASQAQVVELRTQLLDRERSLVEATKALSNLQNVLKELAEEHRQEVAQFEKELEMARREQENTCKQLSELQQKQSQWVEDRRFLEDTVTLLKDDLIRKSGLVEELENQMEELRHSTHAKPSSTSSTTYKIDDATLKQLFLSYLLAERNKQPEIAVVMASILGYSQEEQSSIQEAVSTQYQGSGWFSLGGRRSGGRQASHGPSLTEQFVRFLEKESAAIHQQTALPVQSATSTSSGSGISMDAPHNPSPSGYSSSTDLKHILESN
uniref:GRIP domain-containing protein n=1 Tax=Ditylenchus dipsaci TaxID=166011 RepID=A0A915CZI4_9BILA